MFTLFAKAPLCALNAIEVKVVNWWLFSLLKLRLSKLTKHYLPPKVSQFQPPETKHVMRY